MRHRQSAWPIPFLCAALATAQQAQPAPAPAPTATGAEAAFREAWWAESGRNDLPEALKGYLAAAVADGSESIRARALLAAGAVQQRLGKTESAIATFRQLLRDFPAQADPAEQARVHLRELTAVDLRQGYDEWYERRLFGEDVQLRILERIEALAAKLHEPVPRDNAAQQQRAAAVRAAESAILGYGKGAVPALRHAAESRDGELAEAAVSMLFELGELPAFRVLQATSGWANEPAAWGRILAAGAAERAPAAAPAAVPADAGDPAVARLLAAAWQGPDALLERVVDPERRDDMGCTRVIARALALHSPESLRAVLARACDPAVPFAVRSELQQAFADADEALARRLDAAQWLQLGKDPALFALRELAVRRVAARLRAKDGELFDEILARVQATPAPMLGAMASAVVGGLAQNGAPLQVPWTLSRLQRAFALALGAEENLWPLFTDALRDAPFAALLAEALLPPPAELLAAIAGIGDLDAGVERFKHNFQLQVNDERDGLLLGTRWAEVLAARLAAAWPKWDDGARGNAVLVLRAALPAGGDRGALRKVLVQLQQGAGEALRGQLQPLVDQCGQ